MKKEEIRKCVEEILEEMAVGMTEEMREETEEREDSPFERTVLLVKSPAELQLMPAYAALMVVHDEIGSEEDYEHVEQFKISEDLAVVYHPIQWIEFKEMDVVGGAFAIARTNRDGEFEELTATDLVKAQEFIRSHYRTFVTEGGVLFNGLCLKKGAGGAWNVR